MYSVKLKDYLSVQEEKVAAGTITPGMLLELTSDDEVQAHSVEAGNAPVMVALEDELQGNDIDDDYSADDQVQVWIPQRGEMADMILAAGEVVVIGDLLSSNGDGTLKKHVPESSDYYAATDVTVKPLQVVAQAREAVTTTTATARIEVAFV